MARGLPRVRLIKGIPGIVNNPDRTPVRIDLNVYYAFLWILRTGFWDDAGLWSDTSTWID